jgi:hypothetical protein
MLSLSIIGYMSLIFALGSDRCAKVLYANWALGMLLWIGAGQSVPILATMGLDFATAVVLAALIGTPLARRVALFNAALFALNGAVYLMGSPPPTWHVSMINIIAWAQILYLAWKVWGDGLRAVVADTFGAGRPRHHDASNLPGISPMEKGRAK